MMNDTVKVLCCVLALLLVPILYSQVADAHRDGCHRWHSCPSDSGSYICGDLGYDTYCPKQTTPSYEPPKYTPPKETPAEPEVKAEPKKQVSTPTNKINSSVCSGTAMCIQGKINTVVDGDILYVNSYKVRLSLASAPERGQVGYAEATAFMKKICVRGTTAIVDQDDKQMYDPHGLVLGKVYCSDKNVNSELLEKGHAEILTQYCKKSEFASESWAKKFGC